MSQEGAMNQSPNLPLSPTSTSLGSPPLSKTYPTDATNDDETNTMTGDTLPEHPESGTNSAGMDDTEMSWTEIMTAINLPDSHPLRYSLSDVMDSPAVWLPTSNANTVQTPTANTGVVVKKRKASEDVEVGEGSASKKAKRDSGFSFTPPTLRLSSPAMTNTDESVAENSLLISKKRGAPVDDDSDEEIEVPKRVKLNIHGPSPLGNQLSLPAAPLDDQPDVSPSTASFPATPTSDAGDSKLKVKDKTKRPPRRISTETGKHAPITGRRNQFTWADNEHIDMTPLQVGKIEKSHMKLKLKDVKGKVHTFPYPARKTININKQSDVTRFNNWRRQAINRPLNVRNKTDPKPGAYRHPWTLDEREFLLENIRQQMESTGQRLSQADWTDVTNRQNERFAGETAEVGTPLPATKKNAEPKLKSARTLPERTSMAIQGQVARWSEAKDFINDLANNLPDVDSDSEDDGNWGTGQDGTATHEEAAHVLNNSIGCVDGGDDIVEPADEVEGNELKADHQDDPSDDEDGHRGAPTPGNVGPIEQMPSITAH